MSDTSHQALFQPEIPAWLDVPRGTIDKLLKYNELLHKWQRTINLVAPSTLADSWARHFLDSAQIAPLVKNCATIIDMGSGAGFPGLVIAAILPDTKITLIESDSRKCAFLNTVKMELQLQNAAIVNKRIESVDLVADCVTARALADLDQLMKLAARFSPKKHVFLKGARWDQEVEIARKNANCSTWNILPSLTDKDARIIEIS